MSRKLVTALAWGVAGLVMALALTAGAFALAGQDIADPTGPPVFSESPSQPGGDDRSPAGETPTGSPDRQGQDGGPTSASSPDDRGSGSGGGSDDDHSGSGSDDDNSGSGSVDDNSGSGSDDNNSGSGSDDDHDDD